MLLYMESNRCCANKSCLRKDFEGVALPFLCEFCKTHWYCSQNCRGEDWKAGHEETCELEFRAHIEEIEQACPFLTSGLILNKQETKKKTRKLEAILDNYEKANVEGKATSILGKGAYGKVFLMRNKRTRGLVAMKIMEKKFLGNPDMLKALTREMEIHKTLFHDNIIRLIEHCEDSKNIYLLMEYASKGNLFHYIRASKKLSEKEAFYFFTQACNAIYFLHKHKLMHRDIKPENMLISSTGQLKLCDFGCCAPCDSDGRRSFCGTIDYMAPEVLKQNEYREKADIWSLGILLYEMLHGYAPFQGKKEQETIKKIMEEKLVFNSDIESDAKRLIKALLKENPSYRPCVQEIFDMDWIRRMQIEFKMDDKIKRKVNNTFDDLNRSESTERVKEVKSHTKKSLAQKPSPLKKKELKVVANNVKETSKVNSQPQALEEKKSPINKVKKNIKPSIEKPYQQVKEQLIDFNDQELSYEEIFGITKRRDRLMKGERNEISPVDINVEAKDIIDTNTKEDIDTLIETPENNTIDKERINVNETNTQPLSEEHDDLNKELPIIDEKQESLVQVDETEEDVTNSSFNSDDYALKRTESLLMAINYLDGLDCGLEPEDLDQYVKQIEQENIALRKLYANTPKAKFLNIPITTLIEEVPCNDKAEYKKSTNDIIDSLISIKSHKTKVEQVDKEVPKESNVPMWNTLFSMSDVKGT